MSGDLTVAGGIALFAGVFLGAGGNEIAEARVDGFVPPEAFLKNLRLGAGEAR